MSLRIRPWKNISSFPRGEFNEAGSQKKPDLVIWPETALAFYYGFDKKRSNRVDKCVRQLKTNFLIGSPAFTANGNQTKFL